MLRFVTGSHRLVRNIETPRVPYYFLSYAAELKERATPVATKAGEALIFDTTVVHWSRANASNRLRPVAASLFVPEDSTVVFHWLDQASGGTRFEQFDMEDDGYLDHSAQDFYSGKIRTRSLGFVENRNRGVSLAEFDELMANGEEIRQRAYGNAGLRSGLPNWIRSLVARYAAARA
jgi:hypothetical protein